MVFQDKKPSEDNEVLPGGGLEVDLDRRMCPACLREAPPWETECRDCGAGTVPPEQAPSPTFELPHLAIDDDEDEGDAGDAGEADAGDGHGPGASP